MDFEQLIIEGKIELILAEDLPRYLSFYFNTYQDNLKHTKFVETEFSRWSLISGYYAMHDIAKWFLAKQYRIKVVANVHQITIDILKQVIKDTSLAELLEGGLIQYTSISQDLYSGKKARVNAQYYTGTEFSKQRFEKLAKDFYEKSVVVFCEKIIRFDSEIEKKSSERRGKKE